MEDHSEHPDGGPISGSSIVALAQRFAVKAMESSGDERLKRLARIIKEAPELLGEKTGPLLGSLFAKITGGGKLSPQDEKDIGETLAENPEDAEVVMGFAKASLFDGIVSADEERRAILQSYKFAFGMVCAYMAKATTSVVLRGFIHDEACLSYWHFERSNLKFSDGRDYLFPNGLQIYILDEEPTDERFMQLNLAIRDNKERHLPASAYDFKNNDKVAKVTQINETNINFDQLANDRASQPPVRMGPFGPMGTDYKEPIAFVAGIPAGLKALGVMIDSLYDAKNIQTYRLEEARKAEKRDKERR